jgi:nucleoside-diphosphate-sugar epimerase
MKCILFGGTGEVGGRVARALIESDVCDRVTLLGRRAAPALQDEAKVEQVVVDTSAADFEEQVREHAQGHDVGISCVGIGSGSASMSEEAMMAIEVHLPGQFARGCKAAGVEVFELLSMVGVDPSHADSRFKAFRVAGKKQKAAIDVGFAKLAIFKPGTIVGNAHTPRWVTPLTGLIPDSLGWGNIHVDELARAFVGHLEHRVASQNEAVVSYGNQEMKQLSRG